MTDDYFSGGVRLDEPASRAFFMGGMATGPRTHRANSCIGKTDENTFRASELFQALVLLA